MLVALRTSASASGGINCLILNIVSAYLDSPIIYDRLEVRALRAPLSETLTIRMPAKLHNRLAKESLTSGESISMLIRMALYHWEVSRHETT